MRWRFDAFPGGYEIMKEILYLCGLKISFTLFETILTHANFTTDLTCLRYNLGRCLQLSCIVTNGLCCKLNNVVYVCFSWMLNRQKAVRLRPRPLSPEERLTFHRFPLNDPQRLKLWLLALHRDTILVQSGSLEAVQSTFFTRRFQIRWGKYTTISEVNSRPCVVFKNRYARTNLQRCKFSWQWKPCSVLCFKRTYVITKGLF